MRLLKLDEVCATLHVDDTLLRALREEGIVEVKITLEGEEVLSEADYERLRIICLLLRDLEVNLAGAEIILHMREHMMAMHRQFDEILHELVREIRQRSER